ncbi:protein GFS12 isoform X1 [Cryptomeria japonica]|uniref:protein GFS12 isoform X1 n=1 Tax=Cryptomeria japonica TaxID=3369 RepID=UPI0027DA5382|nr:protein GFS12 isoform X1 [Cryptomeria japonica]
MNSVELVEMETEIEMKVSIEKEMCLEGLERSIRKDLSDRVLVSYGIFTSARPFGSKIVCEVDLIGKEDNLPCKDDTTEFVIQVIAEHGNESFRNDMDVNIVEQSTSKAEERDCITDLSDLNEQVEGTGGECEFEMQSCDLLETRSNFCLGSVVGTSEISKCINGSLNASIDKILMKVLEDTGNLKLVFVENIVALSPTAVRTACYAALESIFWSLNSGTLEENVLSSMNCFLEEKSMDPYAIKFIKSVGMPLSCGEDVSAVSVRHPNIVPILGLLKSTEYMYLVHPKAPFTLENILHFSPGALKTDWHLRFLTYQILSALAYSHKQGIAHRGLSPSNILLTDTYWCWLSGFGEHSIQNVQESSNKTNSSIVLGHKRNICTDFCSCRALLMELKLSSLMDWESDFKRWWEGELSNYEYLLALNRLAGRRWGDRTFHTVMPWVIDFSVRPDVNTNAGWRDLKKSKWHLAKGDEQLDFTYASSEIPHHVSDECLSELAVCSYKARRLPLCVLRRTVRSVYEPNEYPASMQRLYQWTPDECIPEFYADPRVFYSIHEGMSDLVIPSWAATPEEFISLHREALESDRVSMNLHHWIDLTFGYKLSGEASVVAKNVTLSTSTPTVPRSMGRRQLFSRPHPMRKCSSRRLQSSWKDPPEFRNEGKLLECTNESASKMVRQSVSQTRNICSNNNFFSQVDNLSVSSSLEELEELALFIESSRHLTPCYNPILAANSNGSLNFHSLLGQKLEKGPTKSLPSTISNPPYGEYSKFIDCLEAEEDGRERTFQDFLLWQNKASQSISPSETLANDIFAVGCIIAELHLHRPLFDPVSLAAYIKDGILPGLLKKLPPYLQSLIESAIHLDWRRRPSAQALLEMPFFPSTVRSAYWFLAPVHIMGSKSSRLQYAAKLAREGALLSMGSFAAEMCLSSCLPLILAPPSDFDVEAAVHLLREFIRSLKPQAAKSMLLPSIQKILQSAESSHLKVTLLQISFIRDLWKSVGLQAYLENIHPLVIKNLYISYDKNSAAAASVLLVGSCEELGTPITIHQTILPLMQCFGRGITVEGIETLVRIGGHLGDKVIVRQMLPPLRSIILSGTAFSNVDKQEPFQSWHTLAVIDALTVLDGLVRILPSSVVLTELVQDQNSVHAKLLMQNNLNPNLVQPAAKALLAICQHIGPDSTAAFMLPKIKPVLDELAFSQEVDSVEEEMGNRDSSSRMQRINTSGHSEVNEEAFANNKMDLVFLLYPSLALLLGIEKLRQCFTTWLLLEQVLFRRYKWKWKCVGEMSQLGDITHGINTDKSPQTAFNPASLLLNGVGWSIPQSQASKISKSSITRQTPDDRESAHNEVAVSCGKYEPWSWLPTAVDTWEGPEFLGRLGGMKDEHPWRLKASVLHSVRAHPGVLRAVAVEDDECTVFSAGTGPRVRGIVYKWQLSTMDCMIGYTGHEEVVNDICILPGCERIASCDGTVHIWSGQTGKCISTFSENSEISSSVGSILPSMPRETVELGTGVNATALTGGILSAGFHGSLYTCMHCMHAEEKLVAGTGNGYLRFIDIKVGQQLHLWRCEPLESSFSSLVSAICCSGSRDKLEGKRGLSSSSWIAAGFSSGHCRLLDLKSGSIIAHWRAHDGFVTKLAAVDEHLIVSSSLDRTLRLWDLRRSWPTQLQVFRGHSDGVSSFSIWGHDMLSASGSKIGLSSLSRPYGQQQQQRILPQKLYSADRAMKNLSAISTINVLPFSRLFLVGTEDGYLKVCC